MSTTTLYESPETWVIYIESEPVCQTGSPTGEAFDDPSLFDGLL